MARHILWCKREWTTTCHQLQLELISGVMHGGMEETHPILA